MYKQSTELSQRVLLDLSGTGHSDDLFSINDIFENIFVTGSTGSGKTSGSGYYLANAMLDDKNVPPQERVGMIVFLYKKGDAQDWLRWADDNDREDDVLSLIHI